MDAKQRALAALLTLSDEHLAAVLLWLDVTEFARHDVYDHLAATDATRAGRVIALENALDLPGSPREEWDRLGLVSPLEVAALFAAGEEGAPDQDALWSSGFALHEGYYYHPLHWVPFNGAIGGEGYAHVLELDGARFIPTTDLAREWRAESGL